MIAKDNCRRGTKIIRDNKIIRDLHANLAGFVLGEVSPAGLGVSVPV
jgi:hypothetical protein